MKKKTKLLILISWIITSSAFGYFLPTIPIFKDLVGIKVVKVKGYKNLKKEDIKEFFSNQNWFFLNSEEVKNKILKKYPDIKKIDIKRYFFGEVYLYIWEREPFAVVYHNKQKYIIDKDGVKLHNKYNTKNLPLIYIYDKDILLNKDKVQAILDLNNKLKDYLKLKKIIYKGKIITFKTIDDKIIIFNMNNIDSQMEKFKKFIKNVNLAEFKYLDFSFDSMVIARR
ncbi:cell division protein FtsQ/DivIB [Hydrogenothermus marinus]|uniref:Cell division protein FtsQ n=1 Tax=Hydrogenothermus marinus TaxID=133270 RepID=A0A3M0B7Y2_9AQUI|nr:FtsQ-type POTRA domain-containing protein [Hydrogenothermus marinus]RMA93261.1 cell division protein FtsQ [Hydrogenothermus marinus]